MGFLTEACRHSAAAPKTPALQKQFSIYFCPVLVNDRTTVVCLFDVSVATVVVVVVPVAKRTRNTTTKTTTTTTTCRIEVRHIRSST
jgi:hypothetical protein